MPEPIEVRKIPLHSVADASELTALFDAGVIDADRVIAVIGKTEGNGGVNDYTRIIADRAFRERREGRRNLNRTTSGRSRSSGPVAPTVCCLRTPPCSPRFPPRRSRPPTSCG